MGSLANVAVVTLDSPSRSAACEQAAHFNLIRIVRLKPRLASLPHVGSDDGGKLTEGLTDFALKDGSLI